MLKSFMLFEVDWMTHSKLTDRVQMLLCMERGDQARRNRHGDVQQED